MILVILHLLLIPVCYPSPPPSLIIGHQHLLCGLGWTLQASFCPSLNNCLYMQFTFECQLTLIVAMNNRELLLE